MSKDKIPLPEQTFGPGSVLRRKREENEWSVEAVAEALHLSSASVNALEADRYDNLPSATYVIGYWRSYARLLNIDIEETIEANKANLNIVTPESRGLDVSRAYHYNKGIGGILWLLLFIVLSIIGYFIWQQNYFSLRDNLLQTTEQSLNEENVIINDNIDNVPTSSESLQVLRPFGTANENSQVLLRNNETSNNLPVNVPPVNAFVEAEKNSPIASSVIEDNATTIQATETSTGTDKPTEQATNLFSAQNNADLASKSPQPTSTTQPSKSQQQPEVITPSKKQVNETTKNTFILHLSKDSWLDVRDRSNKRIIYKTASAGDNIELEGEAPFYVYIGTPNGVTITLNGKPVNYDTHKSGLFARFKLGEIAETL